MGKTATNAQWERSTATSIAKHWDIAWGKCANPSSQMVLAVTEIQHARMVVAKTPALESESLG